MRDSVEGISEVEEDEDGEQSGVSCPEEVVDFYQGRLVLYFGRETILKGFMEVVLDKVAQSWQKLLSQRFLRRRPRDGPVNVQFGSVSTGCFESFV